MYDQIQNGAFDTEDIMKLLPDIAPHTKRDILLADSADAIGDIIGYYIATLNNLTFPS